ncbi:hypothetical protein YC2023_018509 [Brassica napus]
MTRNIYISTSSPNFCKDINDHALYNDTKHTSTDMIMGTSKNVCSLFDSYLRNHEASMHEITWRMCSTQLRSSSKKNQIKRTSDEGVTQFTKQRESATGYSSFI